MDYMGFVNRTPFASGQFLTADENGADVLSFIVKATYDIKHPSSIVIADEQVPINLAGEYYGDPSDTSLKYAPEGDFTKTTTDIALIGAAYASNGPQAVVDVSFQVGAVGKTLRVFGHRHWVQRTIVDQPTWKKWRPSERKVVEMSSPEPFERMPLMYEYAYGGWDRSHPDQAKHACDIRNPVGRGYLTKDAVFDEPIPLANIEDPNNPIQQPQQPANTLGFGFINPNWQWRSQYAGTYNEQWQLHRNPLMPDDFNRHYFNAANPDLLSASFLNGDEPVTVQNASIMGPLDFRLPNKHTEAVIRLKNGDTERLKLNLDTVIVNTDEHKVFLLWRHYLNVYKKVEDLLWAKTQVINQ